MNVEAIECAEKLVGIDLHSDEETAIAGSLNNRLRTYQQLRQIAIGPEIDPAIMFKPSLPGKEPKGPATPGAAIRYTKAPLTLKRPANLEEVAFWPVAKLAALIERRLVTSTELTRMYLDRLKRYQPTLNFYVTLTEDLAVKQAADADREIKAGKYRGPLHGLPWGAKDLFATKGIVTSWGGEPHIEQVFDYDATIVERLRDAGAVLVAKLTLGALAQGDRWFGGRPTARGIRSAGRADRRPVRARRPPPAASRFRSARRPADRSSRPRPPTAWSACARRTAASAGYGAMALSNTMDKVGPMCRYVEDCALVLNAIYGPDKRDGTVADAAFRWNPDAPLAGYKIAFVRNGFDPAPADGRGAGAPAAARQREPAGVAQPVAGAAGGRAGGAAGGGGGMSVEDRRKVYQEVLSVYRKLGADLTPVDLPDLSIAGTIGFILETESAASFDDLTRSGDVDLLRTGTSASTWPNTFKSGRFVPAVEYLRAQRARVLLMRQMDEFMSKYDALLSAGSDGTLGATNLTGHPAIALKCSIYNSDTPVMLMVTGRLYEGRRFVASRWPTSRQRLERQTSHAGVEVRAVWKPRSTVDESESI